MKISSLSPRLPHCGPQSRKTKEEKTPQYKRELQQECNNKQGDLYRSLQSAKPLRGVGGVDVRTPSTPNNPYHYVLCEGLESGVRRYEICVTEGEAEATGGRVVGLLAPPFIPAAPPLYALLQCTWYVRGLFIPKDSIPTLWYNAPPSLTSPLLRFLRALTPPPPLITVAQYHPGQRSITPVPPLCAPFCA